ncbi:uncharacterized protein LOC123398899 isoform X2 [Hordeum vulgare subsp. vulgare]|uniref:uncharacterized protein LOC123398899 isoform X2 n=1 Tax=Hordeum vulgare subsp. vulgare TaxID=112509 RepID=UPI001D1A4710|nr:uncharacterized protein LOC123398899 isoform X2 [Hordeum vulgare subsp. vulgare]
MDLVVGASTGALQAVLPRLARMLGEEYKLQKGVKDAVRYLHKELESMQTALEKVSQVPVDQVDPLVKLWARDLRDMSYKIQDAIDSYMAHVDSAREPGSSTACCVNVKGMLPRSWPCCARHDIATEIERIRIQVEEVSRRRERCKVDGIAAASPAPSDPRMLSLFQDKEKLVGIDRSSTHMIKLLSMEGEGTSSEHKLKLVSIVGPAGMGKTTLANVVYQKLEHKFACTAFVSVSLKPDIKNIYNSILRQVSSKIKDVPKAMENSKHHQESQRYYGDTHGWSDAEVIKKIRLVLQDKRYLIVIDDIWNERAWKEIKCVLVENKFGSKIITTSRNFDVGKSCCSWDKVDGTVHKLLPLSDNDSKSLFRHKLFSKDEDLTEFDYEAAKMILEKCKGLPLAIVTIASLLANKPKDQWCRVVNSISTGLETSDGVKDMHLILWLSYCDMPPQLRTCFLYLSIFPEDHIIGRDDLIWKWVAENFFPARQDENPYELGDKFFNELINRSMIQPIHVDRSGRAQACRVHDVVLEFITSLSAEENFVTVMNGQPFPSEQDSIHRLSLRGSREHRVPQSIKKLPHVRTLVVSSNAIDLMPSLFIFPVLRVLDLEHCTSVNIVGLGRLVHLRYLRLGISQPTWEKSDLKRLFQSLCNLKNLEALYIFAQDLSLDFMLQVDWATSRLRKLTVCVRPQTEYIIRPESIWSEFSPFSTLPRWINYSLSSLSDLSIIVTVLRQEDLHILAALPILRSVDLEVIDATRKKLEVTSAIGNAIAFRCLACLRFTSRALGLVFCGGAMHKLQQLFLSFALAETNDVHADFDFGLENLISLNAVDVIVDCRCAKVWQMQAAEAALNSATKKLNPNPNKHILRLTKHFEKEMYWDGKGCIPVTEIMKEVEQVGVARTGLWGGNTGQFRDISVAPCRLKSVTICSDEVINSIEFSYIDHNGKQHNVGPWGGDGRLGWHDHNIHLGSSEYLTEVSGTMGRYKHSAGYVITSLTLVSNVHVYGPFGGGGGIPFSTPMQGNGSIVSFFACTGWFVDTIGFYVNANKETIEDDEEEVCCLEKIGPWGGHIGYLRDIKAAPPSRLECVIICSGKVINSLSFSYSDSIGQQHAVGPWSGDGTYDGACYHTISLGPSEFLMEVHGTMDQHKNAQSCVISSLTFITSVQIYGPFGEQGQIAFNTSTQSKGHIVGFFARTGCYVEAIGFYLHHEKKTMEHKEEAHLAKIGPWGGCTGLAKDIKVAPCRLSSVIICAGEVINSIEFSYPDHKGKMHTFGPWGGEGGHSGHHHKIMLGPSEFLIGVSGTMNRYRHAPGYVITSLTFVTNDCSYGPFGDGGGFPFNTPMQSNGSIVGFFARTGWFVDAIGFYVNAEQETMEEEEELRLVSQRLDRGVVEILDTLETSGCHPVICKV